MLFQTFLILSLSSSNLQKYLFSLANCSKLAQQIRSVGEQIHSAETERKWLCCTQSAKLSGILAVFNSVNAVLVEHAEVREELQREQHKLQEETENRHRIAKKINEISERIDAIVAMTDATKLPIVNGVKKLNEQNGISSHELDERSESFAATEHPIKIQSSEEIQHRKGKKANKKEKKHKKKVINERSNELTAETNAHTSSEIVPSPKEVGVGINEIISPASDKYEFNRDVELNALNNALDQLEHSVLPQFVEISNDATNLGISQAPDELANQKQRAQKVAEQLKVCFSIKKTSKLSIITIF